MNGWRFLESYRHEQQALARIVELEAGSYSPTTAHDEESWIVTWEVWEGDDEPDAPLAVRWEIEPE